jgi:hypothetical protein
MSKPPFRQVPGKHLLDKQRHSACGPALTLRSTRQPKGLRQSQPCGQARFEEAGAPLGSNRLSFEVQWRFQTSLHDYRRSINPIRRAKRVIGIVKNDPQKQKNEAGGRAI